MMFEFWYGNVCVSSSLSCFLVEGLGDGLGEGLREGNPAGVDIEWSNAMKEGV
jgi:hypothetical protein